MKTKEELIELAEKSDKAIEQKKKDEINKQIQEKEARKKLVEQLSEEYAGLIVADLEEKIKIEGSKAYGYISVRSYDVSVALKKKLIELGFNIQESYSPQGTKYHDGYGYDEEAWEFTIRLK